MAMRSICPSVVLEDPREDYKNSYRAEQFRVGKQAIYVAAFPGTKYLPFSAIRQAWTQDSSITVTGTCGKSLPVVVLRVRYEETSTSPSSLKSSPRRTGCWRASPPETPTRSSDRSRWGRPAGPCWASRDKSDV